MAEIIFKPCLLCLTLELDVDFYYYDLDVLNVFKIFFVNFTKFAPKIGLA